MWLKSKYLLGPLNTVGLLFCKLVVHINIKYLYYYIKKVVLFHSDSNCQLADAKSQGNVK